MRAWLVAADQVSSGWAHVVECAGAGETCWAVTPSGDSNRDCGCSSGGWAGDGIYMGGYKNSSTCGSEGGGFAGPKTDGIAKGNLDSIGFVMRIRGRASGQRQLQGCDDGVCGQGSLPHPGSSTPVHCIARREHPQCVEGLLMCVVQVRSACGGLQSWHGDQ